MIHDRTITISSAGSRKATRWPAQSIWWSELVEKIKIPVRGVETLGEYLAMPRGRQDELKDVGGFVAGTLANGRRKANAVTGRDVITLDLDNIPPGQTANALARVEGLGCAYAVYSTRKHDESKPRLRVLVPLSRTVTADEYEPLARKLAEFIGIELCDPTTFEASRLMYWPSACADSNFIHVYGDKPMLDADGVLGLYRDWHDISQWPEVPGTQTQVKRGAKQANPADKTGIVGAFCKTYDIYRAMDVFLPGEYEPCDIGPDRYTYTGGSTVGGAVVYDNGQFLFSHHATDPASGQLVNAFDLVRLHRFSGLDDDAKPETPTNRMPSFSAMCELAVADDSVSILLNQERYEAATQDFARPIDTDGETANWIGKLKLSAATGQPSKTVDNVLIILNNDPLLKGKLAFDEFANRGLSLGALPWNDIDRTRDWTDLDDRGLGHYIEKVYNITGKDRVFDAAALCAHQHRFNDVKKYLESLSWDGVKRLDTLLTDYLGAEDNVYTRAVARKSLAAAVARVMVPGCKYDFMPIFAGPQGIGKSTFLRLLGKDWYSDSLSTFEGKEASEMIQGIWINEVGELNGLSKSETNSVKQFLSKTDDVFREAYGRRTGRFPRRCVFFGTTNDSEFLRDRTGNRRFWPVDLGFVEATKSVFTDMEAEVDQIWAEAVVAWRLGERLYLTGEAEKIAQEQQEYHRETNSHEGLIIEFLNRRVPLNWDKLGLDARRLFWANEFDNQNVETVERDKVCAVEVWCELFNGETKFFKRQDAVTINGIIGNLKGWKRHGSNFRTGPYGFQKGFIRTESNVEREAKKCQL